MRKIESIMKKITIIFIGLFVISASLANAYNINEWSKNVNYRSIVVAAPAVGETKNGYFGVITHINVTMMNGSGNVYFSASPLTQIDMQGSAKLAVDVACALAGVDESKYDFLFYVHSDSPIVGGPSAGATMTVATLALIENMKLNDSVAMTGMINPDGSIGPVGGILEKGEAVAKAGKKLFLIPKGQMIEYETKYVRQGGWIIARNVPVNVSEELYQKYGLIVKEVDDINQAFYYFTGYKFNESLSGNEITTSDYRDVMKPLAESIISTANTSYEKASNDYNNANIPLGSIFYSPRAQIKNYLEESENDLEMAKMAYQNDFYYYSISKAFQSMINSRFVSYSCSFYNKNFDYDKVYDNISKKVNDAYDFARSMKINGAITLQCAGAAQIRALDAVNMLNNSLNEWHAYMRYGYDSKALSALYDAAYSMERAKTVYWWANLSKEFNESYKINESWLTAVASKYYDYASQIYAYANTLVSETGSQQDYIKNAKDMLDKAAKYLDDFPAASFFSSLQSIANSNLAIEAIGGLTTDKVNRSSEMASYAVESARKDGIEPIMAVMYYEFGKSLYDIYNEHKGSDNLENAVIYYKYAYMIANVLKLSKGMDTKKPVYVGEYSYTGRESNENGLLIPLMIISFLGGIATGYAIYFAIGQRSRDENMEEMEIESINEDDEEEEDQSYFT